MSTVAIPTGLSCSNSQLSFDLPGRADVQSATSAGDRRRKLTVPALAIWRSAFARRSRSERSNSARSRTAAIHPRRYELHSLADGARNSLRIRICSEVQSGCNGRYLDQVILNDIRNERRVRKQGRCSSPMGPSIAPSMADHGSCGFRLRHTALESSCRSTRMVSFRRVVF